ncbi:protein FAM167A-like [Saccostrea echinata]|uniref:protein FAM167A-like n=1 Tax=Saccostrea echinata TaxID=191078 RepID=UPI002A7F15ED|nr:protein FAM167A-like [Saccostrea echinata]
MSQDHLSALIEISKKLKLKPRHDIESIKNSWLMKPLRRASNSNLLEEITEYAMRRRGSRDNVLDGADVSAVAMRKKFSCSRGSLADVTECVESEKNTTNDPTFGMSLGEKLQYVLRTLNEIRQEDQIIARKFLHIYAEIKKSKVRQSCMIHQEMLDEVFSLEHDHVKLPHVCDAPVNKRSSHALQQCGVTRMNIKSKRFSCS